MARNLRQRWYSSKGQSRTQASALERSSGVRKLASLLVLLALVLILIQETSDVKKVEKVATAIGLLPSKNESFSNITTSESKSTSTDEAANANSTTSGKADAQGATENEIDSATLNIVSLEPGDASVETYYQIWKALLKRAPVPAVGAMARKLFRDMGQESNDAASKDTASKEAALGETSKARMTAWDGVRDWFAECQYRVASWGAIETENAANQLSSIGGISLVTPSLEFADLLEKQSAWFQQFDSVQASPISFGYDKFFRSLQLALDEKLLEQVVDNSNWGGADRLPFVRTLQRVGIIRELLASKKAVSNHFPKLEVSQLLSDSRALRARPMRFEGSIARVDSNVSIAEPGFGTFKYQVIWLRPYETSNQPVCVYVPVENVDSNVKLESGTEVVVTGVFFKRMAHSSERGGDVSPLLLAAYIKPFGSNETLPINPFLESRNPGPTQSNWRPPVDTRTPFMIVQARLQQSISGLDVAALEAGFQAQDASEVVKPIFELQRLVPEINLLLGQTSDWPIANNATLTRVSGIVTKIFLVPISSQLASLLEQPHIYRCDFESGSQSMVFLVAAIPAAWKQKNGSPLEAIRQPCQVDMLRLVDEAKTPYGWARSIQWTKANRSIVDDSQTWNPSLSKPFAFLFNHHWDLAWLDQVRELQSDPIKPLSTKEIEPFYSLMKIAKESPYATPSVTSLTSDEPSIVSVLDSLTKSSKSVKPAMERVAMNMRIVRVSRVAVDDPAMAVMLGSDRYYQLDTMADIGNREYEDVGDKSGDQPKEPVVYHKEYPVTCVMLDVPEWLLKDEAAASGPDSKLEHVWYPRMKTSGAGWFYRFWSYKTQETLQSLGENHRQRGPLVVLDSLQLGNASQDGNGLVIAISNISNSITVFIGVLGALGIWWFVRRSAKPRRR